MKPNDKMTADKSGRPVFPLSDDSIKVPAGLRKDLSDMIDAMDVAEKILSEGKHPVKRTMIYIMSIAAGIVLFIGIWMAVGTFRTPKDTFTDPKMAYAEVERALASISEKMGPGLEKAGNAEKAINMSVDKLKSVYKGK